jgi:hypothetical protein
MSNRARIFAAVTLLISCCPAALAQVQNLEAGKSPSQLFAGTCNACHKSPRGLLKTVSPGSLSGFLREHYTTGGDMASQLATYLISNGASDRPRAGADKQGPGGGDQVERQSHRTRNAPGQESARPDDAASAGEGARQGRRRQVRPGEAPEEGGANVPAPANADRGPDGRRISARQRSKPARPTAGEEPAMASEPSKSEPPKSEPPKSELRQEMGNANTRPDAETESGDDAKSDPAKSESAKIEGTKDSPLAPAIRQEPAPSVSSASTPPAPAAAPPDAASGPAAERAGASERPPEHPASRAPADAASEPQAITASAPPSTPPGPPAPPMSQ